MQNALKLFPGFGLGKHPPRQRVAAEPADPIIVRTSFPAGMRCATSQGELNCIGI